MEVRLLGVILALGSMLAGLLYFRWQRQKIGRQADAARQGIPDPFNQPSNPASPARMGVVFAVVMLASAAGLVLAGRRDMAVVIVLVAAGLLCSMWFQ